MKNVVKKENAVARQFLGVDFVVLSIGKDTMGQVQLARQELKV
ncbi:MAG: hypothetical protein ACN6PN_05255 [Sphingobacterium sp.]|jgi:hypothetical protein